GWHEIVHVSFLHILRQEAIGIVRLRVGVDLLISVYEEGRDDDTTAGGKHALTHLEVILQRANDVGHGREEQSCQMHRSRYRRLTIFIFVGSSSP
ncbi:hypothetical protein PENTCL1PPCAC_5994, partial [Pristionchus entomophagus]